MYLLDLVSEPLEAALLVGGLAPLLEAPGVAKTVRGGQQVGRGLAGWLALVAAAHVGRRPAARRPAARRPFLLIQHPRRPAALQVAQALSQQFNVALAGARS